MNPSWRSIRVFVSSTFRDMQEERDLLIKRVFPQLRKFCEERAVTWTEVDLRWGITDEQKAEGRVLPLCLEEIRRCRPYFIGLLGERYGWVPDAIPDALLESQPWLVGCRESSVTELEILHGVLRNSAMDRHAYFYFRHPNYVQSIPPGQRGYFVEESTEAAAKLERLKERIRVAEAEQVCKLREGYSNPEQLGQWILEDFTELIDRLYPNDKTPNPLDLEAARHEAFARNRRLAFIGREDLLRRMNEQVAVSSEPLVVTGESGCGKSALLAEWAARWHAEHPADLILQHYLGSTPDSADWQRLVRRILGELKRAFAIEDEIPNQREALWGALQDWTAKAAGRRRVVLVLDALNQLAEDGASRQLTWLPSVLPSNFRILVSSLAGESLDVMRKRGWPELNVPAFSRADIAPAALAYFQMFSKTPTPEVVAQLESAPAASNALYLRAVLDELRQSGRHEELRRRADAYLSAPDIPSLFEIILERWETDFGADVVRESLSLIWAARYGFSETEILDLLGKMPTCNTFGISSTSSGEEILGLLREIRKPREPMPRAQWTPFFLACEAHLACVSGLLTLSHSGLRAAVTRRYIPTSCARRALHERLAMYFELAPLPIQSRIGGTIVFDEGAITTSRAVDEEAWQLKAAERWEALANHLSCLPVFIAACSTGREFEWMQYWQDVLTAVREGAAPPVDVAGLHLAGLRQLAPEGKMFVGGMLGQFLWALGYLDAAEECLAEEGRADGFAADNFIRAGNLNDQGLIESDRGEKQKAMTLFEEAAALLDDEAGRRGDPQAASRERRLLASILMNNACVVRETGDMPRCGQLLERALALMSETTGPRSPEVATVLQSMGNAALAEGNYDRALSLQCQAHSIRREKLGPLHRDVGLSLGNAGNALAKLEHYHYAMTLWEQSLEILRRTVGDGHHFSLSVNGSLRQCETLAVEAMKNASGYGLVLLVFDSLSPEERPPDPTTSEGARAFANAIRDNLVEIWDDVFGHRSSVPVLVITCPDYEVAASLAAEESIARRFTGSQLTWLHIPRLVGKAESPAAIVPLVSVMRGFLNWLETHEPEVIMIKPVSAFGATFDRRILAALRTDPTRVPSRSPGKQSEGERPLAVEVVPAGELDGPLLGLYTGGGELRPCVMPVSDWRRQNYTPRPGDERATGVAYLNLPVTRQWLDSIRGTGADTLDDWSMDPLLDMSSVPREGQLGVLESALSSLMRLLWTTPIRCPAERGRRGFRRSATRQELDDLLT